MTYQQAKMNAEAYPSIYERYILQRGEDYKLSILRQHGWTLVEVIQPVVCDQLYMNKGGEK